MSKKLSEVSKIERSQICFRVKEVLPPDSMEVVYPEKDTPGTIIESNKIQESENVEGAIVDLDSLESKNYSEIQNVAETQEKVQLNSDVEDIEIEHFVSYLIRYRIPNINPTRCTMKLPVDKYLILSDFHCLSFPIDSKELEQESGFKYKKAIRRKCRELNISLSKIKKISHLQTITESRICNHVYLCELNQFPRQPFPNILHTSVEEKKPCWKDYFHLTTLCSPEPPFYLKSVDSQQIDISVL